jgi:hypothetical protein
MVPRRRGTVLSHASSADSHVNSPRPLQSSHRWRSRSTSDTNRILRALAQTILSLVGLNALPNGRTAAWCTWGRDMAQCAVTDLVRGQAKNVCACASCASLRLCVLDPTLAESIQCRYAISRLHLARNFLRQSTPLRTDLSEQLGEQVFTFVLASLVGDDSLRGLFVTRTRHGQRVWPPMVEGAIDIVS